MTKPEVSFLFRTSDLYKFVTYNALSQWIACKLLGLHTWYRKHSILNPRDPGSPSENVNGT